MKRARHTEEQIIAVLQEAQAGATIEELAARDGNGGGSAMTAISKISLHGESTRQLQITTN